MTPCNAEPFPNRIKSGNFESFSNPWGTGQYSDQGLWYTKGKARVKAKAVKLKRNGWLSKKYNIRTALYINNKSSLRAHRYGTTSQRITVRRNSYYRITLWATAKNLVSAGGVQIVLDQAWKVRPISLHQGTYSWRYFSAIFYSGTNDFVDLRILSQDKGEVLITGMRMYRIHEAKSGIASLSYKLGKLSGTETPTSPKVRISILPAHQFFINLNINRNGIPYMARYDRINYQGKSPITLVNGTYILAWDGTDPGIPNQAFGDTVIDGVYHAWGIGIDYYNPDANNTLRDFGRLLADRYYFGVTWSGEPFMAQGRVPPSNSKLRWALGGLGGLLNEGIQVRFEAQGVRLYRDNAQGHYPVARTVVATTWDNQIALVSIGEGRNRGNGATIQQVIADLRQFEFRDAVDLDGGSPTLLYYRNRLVAQPSGRGYESNYSFAGAVEGRDTTYYLSSEIPRWDGPGDFPSEAAPRPGAR